MPNWEDYLSEEAKLRAPSVMKAMGKYVPIPGLVSLGAGLPHKTCFPFESISFTFPSKESNFTELVSANLGEDPNATLYEALQYSGGKGNSYLHDWTIKHMKSIHKPSYEDWSTVITAGATQCLDSTLRMLCNPNEDTILVEEQTYPAALETCRPLRITTIPVELDSDGINPEKLDKLLTNWDSSENLLKDKKKPRIIYTMPTGQNPTGITMPLQRRKDFYKICQKHEIIIIEDDPYYFLQLDDVSKDFSHEKILDKLIPSLLHLDTDGRVIRFDSFSKIVIPGSRTSWITANNLFVERLIRHNEVNTQSTSGVSQLLLYSLISEWKDDGFLKWLDSLRYQYTTRRDTLMRSFDKYLPRDLCSWNCPSSGMFLWIKVNMEKFPKLESFKGDDEEWASYLEDKIFDSCIENKILLAKSKWFIVAPSEKLKSVGFRGTFAAASFEDMEVAPERFAQALKEVQAELYN